MHVGSDMKKAMENAVKDWSEVYLALGCSFAHITPKRENDNYYQQYGSYFRLIVQAIKGDFIRPRCWY